MVINEICVKFINQSLVLSITNLLAIFTYIFKFDKNSFFIESIQILVKIMIKVKLIYDLLISYLIIMNLQ